MPQVYNQNKSSPPPPPLDAVYIGRGSPWGNPFVIGKHGTRGEVCDKYEKMVEADKDFRARIVAELAGKDLVCFCKPLRCHGDYLLSIANSKQVRSLFL